VDLDGGRWLWWLQETLRIVLYFSIFLGFYLQFQDNHFIPVCLLVSTYVALCNLVFD
jgi:hypothetical protein